MSSAPVRERLDALTCFGSHDQQQFLRELEAVHLYWFAAEDEGRTEEPTEHKIRKAREEEGKVAKSQDLSAAIIMLFCAVTLALLSSYSYQTFQDMVRYFLSRSSEIDITEDGTLLPTFYGFFIRLTLPVAAVAFAAAVMGNLIQVGFLFTTKPITPDLKKVVPNFTRFIQKSFLSTEAIFNLAKAIGKVIIIITLAFVNIRSELGRIVNLASPSISQAFGVIAWVAFRILVQAAIILLVLSLFDYLFQRRLHREQLKMTKQEVKEERKTYEGDPMVKGRMKQRMREMLSRNMVRKVPEADVVITNPTHYAVALEYHRERMQAPMVTAKGKDAVAERMKQLAGESAVPIIENKPLARALYAEVEIGDIIPERFYEAVVAVLKQVYQMDRARARTW